MHLFQYVLQDTFKVPFIIYENNLLIGKANRYFSSFCKKNICYYKDIEGINTKHKNKTIVIGNIIKRKYS